MRRSPFRAYETSLEMFSFSSVHCLPTPRKSLDIPHSVLTNRLRSRFQCHDFPTPPKTPRRGPSDPPRRSSGTLVSPAIRALQFTFSPIKTIQLSHQTMRCGVLLPRMRRPLLPWHGFFSFLNYFIGESHPVPGESQMTAGELQMAGRGKLGKQGEIETIPGESGKWGNLKKIPGEFETIPGETEKMEGETEKKGGYFYETEGKSK